MKGLSSHTMRIVSMPLGMVVGALLCRPIVAIDAWSSGWITPLLIFVMLFFTYCRVDITKMRVTMMHFWLFAAQIVGSMVIYSICQPLGTVVAQGAMICALAPIAMAAVVIGGMLGANVTTMVTYSLLCNLVTAIVAPFILHAFGNGTCTFLGIIGRVAPTLIAPFVVAQVLRFVWRRAAEWVAARSSLSFYLWLISLVLVMGRTTAFIIDTDADIIVEVELALVALVLCLVQFKVGHTLGHALGDVVAGGQSVGQKNTILAIWMTLNFLNPIASIAPTAYIVWQNFVNSYQIYRTNHKRRA